MCSGTPPPPTMYRPYANDDDGNAYRQTLGPYRGNQPAFHADHPVIFEHSSSAPNKLVHGASGTVTAEKGFLGTIGSLSFFQGKTHLIVYGDAKTGEPSSWTLFEWTGTGKKFPETNTEIYEWRKVPNAKAALSKSGFYESFEIFSKQQNNK